MAESTPKSGAEQSRPSGADEVSVQLPKPPAGHLQMAAGESQNRAQQDAERAIRTGSLDSPGVEATVGDLPYESVRTRQAGVEKAAIAASRAESAAIGEALLEKARRGMDVGTHSTTRARSAAALQRELDEAEAVRDTAKAAHERSVRQLDGDELCSDGTKRPGNPIAPGTKRFGLAIAVAVVLSVLPVLIPIAVEGTAVDGNMKKYLRADDADWGLPLVIAVITVGILTLVPYLLGITLNKLEHGKSLSPRYLVAAGAAAALWIVVGVTLALVRVDVDRAAAIQKAEDGRLTAIDSAQGLGQPASSVPAVDVNAVFNPVLPTIFWIAVFIGFGLALILWELAFYNPARLHELRRRRAYTEASAEVVEIADAKSEVDGSMALQQKVNQLTVQMWDAEATQRDAAAAYDIAIHHQSLGEESADPAMPLAIEQHKLDQAARRAAQPHEVA